MREKRPLTNEQKPQPKPSSTGQDERQSARRKIGASQPSSASEPSQQKAFAQRRYSERPAPTGQPAPQMAASRKNPSTSKGRGEKAQSSGSRWLLIIGTLLVLLMGTSVGLVVGAINMYLEDLPKIAMLENYDPELPSRMYNASGEKIAEFFRPSQNRQFVTLSQIPKHLIHAIISIEDRDFYEHFGISLKGFLRAAVVNYKLGRIEQGGSTITMQLAEDLIKNGHLPEEYNIPQDIPLRSYRLKIYETLLALQIEKRYTKDEILEIYLNQVFMGRNIHGVAKAAQAYFGKRVSECTLKECALFAGMLKAPNNYDPGKHPEAAQRRSQLVLHSMLKEGYITQEQYQKAVEQPFDLSQKSSKQIINHPYFSWAVVNQFRNGEVKTSEGGPIEVLGQGVDIYTTVDSKLQEIALTALRNGIEAQEKFHRKNGGKYWGAEGYRFANSDKSGALKTGEEYDARIVRGYEEASGDIQVTIPNVPGGEGPFAVPLDLQETWLDEFDLLQEGYFIRVRGVEQEGEHAFQLGVNRHVQGALIAVQPSTGAVLALVGGHSFYSEQNNGQYNRAIQAKDLLPGSAYKPLLYTCALADPSGKWTLASILQDKAINYYQGWTPSNYYNRYFGNVTLQYALTHSLNAATVWLLDHLRPTRTASYNYFRQFARQVFDLDIGGLQVNLSVALGTSGTSPWELAQAYQVLANGGNFNQLHMVNRVDQRTDGRGYELTLYDFKQPYIGMERLSPQVSFLATHLLRNVVEEGTATDAQSLPFYSVGKTGTTNSNTYAWFTGYSRDILCVVYFGYDDNSRSLGRRRTGSRVALPVWTEFLKTAYEHRPELFGEIHPPSNIVYRNICERTGLLAGDPKNYVGPDKPIVKRMPFIEGTEPKKLSPYYRGNGSRNNQNRVNQEILNSYF